MSAIRRLLVGPTRQERLATAPGEGAPPEARPLGLGRVLARTLVTAVVAVEGVALLILGFLASGAVLTGTYISWQLAAALSVPLLLVRVATRRKEQFERTRAIAHAWLLAVVFLTLLSAERVSPVTDPQEQILRQMGLCAIFIGLVGSLLGFLGRQVRLTGEGVPQALFFGLLLSYPSLVVGALGSALDTLLNLLAGLLFGVAAALVLCFFQLAGLGGAAARRWWRVLVEGLAVGITLLLMGAAYGAGAVPGPLMFEFPALGWLAVIIALWSANGEEVPQINAFAMFSFLGLVSAALFTLSDPFAGLGLLNEADSWKLWVQGPPIVSGLTAVAMAICVGVLSRFQPGAFSSMAFRIGPIVLALAGVLLYAGFGHPGFFGRRTIVILNDQAILSSIGLPSGVFERRTAIYERLVATANTSQAGLREKLERAGLRYKPYYIVNAIEVFSGDLPVRWWLERQPEVAHIQEAYIFRPHLTGYAPQWDATPTPSDAPEWNLEKIGANRARRESKNEGEGIVVGLIDSGADREHPELVQGLRGTNRVFGKIEPAWLDPETRTSEPVDHNGHGTAVLSVAVGRNLGVARKATWIACALSDGPIHISFEANLLDCLQFMLAPHPEGGNPFVDGNPALSADVVNLSYSCPSCGPLKRALLALNAAGIAFVTVAGNEGPWCRSIGTPFSQALEAFTVGSLAPEGGLSMFSSIGPVGYGKGVRIKPDLVAPGEGIEVALPGNHYAILDGTSFAAPHVAGVIALMWSANPALRGDVMRTEVILKTTADRPVYLDQGPDANAALCDIPWNRGRLPNVQYGYGIVNAYKAVLAALQLSSPKTALTAGAEAFSWPNTTETSPGEASSSK